MFAVAREIDPDARVGHFDVPWFRPDNLLAACFNNQGGVRRPVLEFAEF